jgi:hypothetical protein
MRLQYDKHSIVRLASRINETQILQAEHGKICKLNYPGCKTHQDIPEAKLYVAKGDHQPLYAINRKELLI